MASRRGRTFGIFVGLALVALLAAPREARAQGWATSQASELVRQGREHAARGEHDVAAQRYRDAIGFDATFGAAYLELGGELERAGDAREAERTYTMGVEHVTGFHDGLLARARLRARLHRPVEAASDLESVATARPDDLDTLRELERVYVAANALPAALGVARRVRELARAKGDPGALADARATVRALELLVADADPVASGKSGRGLVRSALARNGTESAPRTRAR